MKNIRNQSGFSIIDLLIGATLSILTLTVMVNSVILADRQKKQTYSVSDVQASGQVSGYYLSRDLRMAGYGLTRESFTNCLVNAYDTIRTSNFTFALRPVSITSGGAGAFDSDTLSMTYGSADVTSTTSKLQSLNNGTNNSLQVDNRYGFRPGDLAVMFSTAVDANADTVPDCTLTEITSLPSITGQTNLLVRGSSSYTSGYSGLAATPRYNKTGGIGISYPAGSQLFNLGPTPASYSYSVVTGNVLRRTNLMTGATQDLGDNVVSTKYYYIKDTNLDGVADTMDQTIPATADGWKQVMAIRYAIVVRSTTTQADPITTITVVPSITLPNGTSTTPIVQSITGADRFYSYKVYGTTVALRNIVWRDS